MIQEYAPFVHKQARKYYEKYQSWYNGNHYAYDDFYQEAAIAFIETLRSVGTREHPLSQFTLGCARNNIHKQISMNLLMRHDSVHRTQYSISTAKQTVQVVNTVDTSDPREDIAELDDSLADAEFRAALDRLSPMHKKVAIALLKGVTRNQLLTSKIVSRDKLRTIIKDLKATFAPEE